MLSTRFARLFISGSVAVAITSLSIASFARPPYPGILRQVFPKTTLTCTACHDGAPPKLNAKYGKAVKAVLDKSSNPKVLTVDEVKALAKKGIKPAGVK